MTDDAHQRRRFEVVGRVQGVGFRFWVLKHARELGLRGSVRNRHDGAVEVDAGGAGHDLDRLRDLLAAGPPLARVDEVRVLPNGQAELPQEFRIVG